jgi:hypothetical protein
MECDSTPDRSRVVGRDDRCDRHKLTLELDNFAWETLSEQSSELGVSIDELATFSVLYYLADIDSKRIARRVPTDLRSLSEGR